MHERPTPRITPATRPALLRTLSAAGLPTTGRYSEKAGWASRAWIGDDHVVRLGDGRARDAYRHEARVVALLSRSDVPHARHIADGDGPDGPWSVSERLPGRTLQEAWPEADPRTRRALIESLGEALRALHRVPVPAGLLPPWLADALAGGAWPAYHPPVARAAPQLIEAARRAPGHDPRLLAAVVEWVAERLPLLAADAPVLVHGDLHGSNVMVDGLRVTGLIDLAEASAQPADVELDTLLRWCARPEEFPATPGGPALEAADLADVPGWLRGAYPELFEREHLREPLHLYDMTVELAIAAHHPEAEVRAVALERVARLLDGHDHLDRFASVLMDRTPEQGPW